MESNEILAVVDSVSTEKDIEKDIIFNACLLYTSPSPRD